MERLKRYSVFYSGDGFANSVVEVTTLSHVVDELTKKTVQLATRITELI